MKLLGRGRGASSGSARQLPAPRPIGARQRLFLALSRGTTVNAAAAEAGVPAQMAALMVDEMQRQGLLGRAESLCASGLGACGAGAGEEARLHCAGCPLLPVGFASR